MDAYLLDTSIASIAWDGGNKHHSEIRQRIKAFGEDSVSVCVVSLGEVEYGLQVSPGIDASRHTAVRSAMYQYKIWDIDRHTTSIYAVVRGELFKRYAPRDKRGRLTKKRPEELRDRTTSQDLGIQENDLWIVSVAVQYDLQLVTQDERMQRILEIVLDTHGYDRAILWSFPS